MAEERVRSWAFEPIDDKCLDCNEMLNPKRELNYILYDHRIQDYKRQCGRCHDTEKKPRTQQESHVS